MIFGQIFEINTDKNTTKPGNILGPLHIVCTVIQIGYLSFSDFWSCFRTSLRMRDVRPEKHLSTQICFPVIFSAMFYVVLRNLLHNNTRWLGQVLVFELCDSLFDSKSVSMGI